MIRAIIVDDEPKALSKISKQLEMSGKVQIAGAFISPLEALETVKNIKIDAAFLDIEMSEIDGLTLANHLLDIDSRIAVVFVTAFNEYAVKAFRMNAIDYILKPATSDIINEAIERIIRERNIVELKSEIKVCCFGKFKVVCSSYGEELKWRTKKSQEIFAYLVDSMGRVVCKDELLEKVFGEFNSDNAYNYLKTSIYYIKRTLTSCGIEGLVKNIKGGYKLDTKKIDCDYYQFTSILSEPMKIDASNISKYEELLNVYCGGYFEGNFYTWAEEKNQKLGETYVNLLIDMADYYKSTGDYIQSINTLRKGLKADLLNRELNKTIIETYIDQKDKLAAIKHFDSYKRKLKLEFGMEVDEEIRKILK